MSTHSADAGMRAVARVRGVRESDSRIGLQTALREHRVAQERVTELRGRLSAGAGFAAGSAAEFVVLRDSLAALGTVLVAAQDAADQAQSIRETALARWQQDKTRLAAIEMLLERRAVTRRAERARAEATELDDLAAQGWLRDRTEAAR